MVGEGRRTGRARRCKIGMLKWWVAPPPGRGPTAWLVVYVSSKPRWQHVRLAGLQIREGVTEEGMVLMEVPVFCEGGCSGALEAWTWWELDEARARMRRCQGGGGWSPFGSTCHLGA